MATAVNPEAELRPRRGDEELSPDELLELSLFANMRRPPSFAKHPGATRLRRYDAGQTVCRQGEAGWTAFYILTSEDLLALRERQLPAAEAARQQATADSSEARRALRRVARLEQEVADLQVRLAARAGKDEATLTADQCVATARLLVRLPDQRASANPLVRFFGSLIGGVGMRDDPRPKTIPIDGPAEIDARSMAAPMNEGELFGEMSCLTRSPRSATVVADRDCYMLEMLSVVLNQMQKDPGYREQMAAVYRERVLAGHLRRLPIFEQLPNEAFESICQSVELENFEPGQVICDEHAPSDSMYIIRGGLVKVVKNLSTLFGPQDISDDGWGAVAGALVAGGEAPDTPAGKVWSQLSDQVQSEARAVAGASASEATSCGALRAAVNQLIVSVELPAAFGKKTADVVAAVADAKLNSIAEPLTPVATKWSDVELRTFNRALLEAVFPSLAAASEQAAPRRTLAYLSRGDFIGEMGLITGEPRNATCIAFDHPDSGQAMASGPGGVAPPRVELVRVGQKEFQAMIDSSPALKERILELVQRRQAQTAERLETPVWQEADSVRLSPRFEELGLIQGQSLMLIDLERCTRCGDCVRACVGTHADRRARLYLDGPRFGKFLVPLTCRECLDPVCMIGCPVGAIHRGDRGEMIIRDWCIGCGLCANQCPYGSIQMHDLAPPASGDGSSQEGASTPGGTIEKLVTQSAVVCDLCSASATGPACVAQCPHDAAIRVDTRAGFPQR